MKELLDPLPVIIGNRMPKFVTGWMIADLSLVSLLALFLPPVIWWKFSDFSYSNFITLALLFLIVLTGMIGDIGLICKEKWALSFARIAAIVVFMDMIWHFIQIFMDADLLSDSSGMFSLALCALCVVTLFRIALQVFYLIALSKAAKFFRDRNY